MISSESINNLTILVRQTYHISTPVGDIEQIIRDMNGRIEVKADLDELCDGTVAKEGDSFIIAVSPNEIKSQRRFTIMRNLGHVFLHMGFKNNPKVWRNLKDGEFIRFNSIASEYEANEFALDLMMPKGSYFRCIERLVENGKGGIDLRDVARYFGVTFEDALQRGHRLGIIE